MLKLTSIVFGTLISFSTFASTHGGGVMSPTAMTGNFNFMGGTGGGGVLTPKRPTEIVYNIGKKDGVVKFAYGQLVGQDWQVQNVEMPEADLMRDVSVIKALQDSSALKSWAEIK